MTSIKGSDAENERAFHDTAFKDAVRSAQGKYYSISTGCFDYYRDQVVTGCRAKKVLEIGCGPESQALLLASRQAVVTGIDISPVAIEMSRERVALGGQQAEFFCMDAHHTTFADDTFDIVCGSGILHHLEVEPACREILRVLKPGGRAVFLEPMGHNPLIETYRRLTPKMRTEGEHPLMKGDLELIKGMFASMDANYFNLFTLLAVPLRNTPVFRPVLKALSGVDSFCFAALPPVRNWAWMVVVIMGK
jgi:SAM-dependent methyltransferase